jgi:hypothetical protein
MATHKDAELDIDLGYESNVVGLRGILYFGLGLFLLIVVTFGLMWFLLGVMEEQAVETKSSDNPLKLTKQEALPPEPRLQSAPGFGVDNLTGGRTDLELREPQAEYRVLLKQWTTLQDEGQKDPATGTVISLPIRDAKEKFLAKQPAADSSGPAASELDDSRMLVSEASAGRKASIRVR